MWHAQDKSQDIKSEHCKLLDSGFADAEFLSNTTVSSDSVVLSANHQEPDMKMHTEVSADSGFDLADNLSRIDLENNKEEQLKILVDISSRDTNVKLKEYLMKDEDGDTLLHNAIIYSYHALMLRLVLNAPNPQVLSSVNKDGHTPLHLAVLAKQSGIVRLLVLSGANLLSRSRGGNTPLHLACQIGNLECAKALLDPISMVEHAYHIQVNRRLTPIPQDLEIKNYTGQACLHIATQIGSVALMRQLLCMGADLEAREGLSGKTALMMAITDNKQEVIEFLLTECRPNFETQNYAGLTAYQVALSVGNYVLADRLLQLGAIAEPLPEVEYSSEEDMDDDSDDDLAFNNSLDSNN